MSEIVWEEPPPRMYGADSRQGKWDQVAAELKANPGQWARLRECKARGQASVWAMQVKRGKAPCWRPAGAFEAVSRGVDGVYVVYARYVGEAES